MKGADLLVQELLARGVTFVAVLCGNGLDPFLTAATEAGLRLVATRNEQAASYMADAYARLTGRVGVCAVSSGVAHINALAGVGNAHFDGAPLLLITGASPLEDLPRGAFQALDQVALAEPLCKYAELVTRPTCLPHAIHEAFAAATSGRPGPVHLTIPIDVLTAEIDPAEVRLSSSTRGWVREQVDSRQGTAYREKHPPCLPYTDYRILSGVVNEPIEEFLGVIGAATGEPRLLEDADLLLLAGALVDYRVHYLDSPPLAESLQVIRGDLDPSQLRQGVEPDIAMLADPRTAFQQLEECWRDAGYESHEDWLREARQRHGQFYSLWDTPPPVYCLPYTVCHGRATRLPRCTGNPAVGRWLHNLCPRRAGECCPSGNSLRGDSGR